MRLTDRCATSGVTQPRSYEDTVTHKHKIYILKLLKMIDISKVTFYTPREKFLWVKKYLSNSNKFVHCYTVKKNFFDLKKFFLLFLLLKLKK